MSGHLIIDLDGDLALSRRDQVRLQHPRVGGVILFSRNFEDRGQLRALTADIKALRSPPLLITVDQEGGRVQRFKGRFTRLPSAGACGRLYDSNPKAAKQLAYHVGLIMARELIDCGVDLSFAPVLDVLSHDSEVIGDRAFHSDPEAVHFLAYACIKGMQDAGMGSVGKHFPGHGGVGADSHVCTPEDGRSMTELRNSDLLPYMSLGNRLAGVMLAHVLYTAINPSIPSYSSFWIRDVLKEDVGFKGVVFSDDLTMAGAGEEPLLGRCHKALRAGCDLLPVCNDLKAVDELLDAPEEEWGEGVAATSWDVIASLYPKPSAIGDETLVAARESIEQAVSDLA